MRRNNESTSMNVTAPAPGSSGVRRAILHQKLARDGLELTDVTVAEHAQERPQR
jgi:hypothetical protein